MYNYSRENNVQARRDVLKMMKHHRLVNIYRQLNPTVRRFTWKHREPYITLAYSSLCLI